MVVAMAEVPWNEGRPDHALVLHLQEQVADALTRQRQQRAARGEPELNARISGSCRCR